MSIMSRLFGGTAVKPQEPTEQQVANPTVPSGATPSSDGKTPAIPATALGDKSPLSEFAKIWDTPGSTEASYVPKMNADPAKLREVSKGLDFTKSVDPALAQKALAGDQAAFMQVMNSVSQAAFEQNSAVTTAIVQQALDAQAEKFTKEYMPAYQRNQDVSREFRADNPLFTDPSVAPMLSMVEKQMTAAYPTASPAEVSQKAREYLVEFGGKVSGQFGPKPKQSASVQETDWSSWMGLQ